MYLVHPPHVGGILAFLDPHPAQVVVTVDSFLHVDVEHQHPGGARHHPHQLGVVVVEPPELGRIVGGIFEAVTHQVRDGALVGVERQHPDAAFHAQLGELPGVHQEQPSNL
jgi:hypothetical protein